MADQHSRISPSGLKSLIQCPGSLQYVESLNLPPLPLNNTDAAAEGIRLHDEMASTPMSPLALKAQDIQQQLLLPHGDGCSSFKELHVNVLSIPLTITGTLDFAVYDPDACTAHIIDYKFGHAPVKAFRNPQLLSYAIGFSNYIRPHASIHNWVLSIIQPRVSDKPDTWIVSSKTVVEEFHTLLDTVEKALEADYMAHLNPDPAHCRYCRGAPYCPRLKELTQLAAQELFREEKSMEQMFKVYEQIPLLEQYIDMVKKQVRKHLLEHGSAHGWKIEATRGRRGWGAATDAVACVLECLNIPPWKKTLRTPTDVLKEVKDPAVRKKIEPYIEYAEGKGLKIVPENKQIENNAEKVFLAYRQDT